MIKSSYHITEEDSRLELALNSSGAWKEVFKSIGGVIFTFLFVHFLLIPNWEDRGPFTYIAYIIPLFALLSLPRAMKKMKHGDSFIFDKRHNSVFHNLKHLTSIDEILYLFIAAKSDGETSTDYLYLLLHDGSEIRLLSSDISGNLEGHGRSISQFLNKELYKHRGILGKIVLWSGVDLKDSEAEPNS